MTEPRWTPTKWRKPKTGDKPLMVRFRNGVESRYSYTAGQLVWADRGWDFDIVAVARAPE